jgi:hypothetical protein
MSTTVILSLVGGVIFVGLIALWIAFKKGENNAEGEQAKQGVENAKKAIKIDSGVHRLDAPTRERLLNRRD